MKKLFTLLCLLLAVAVNGMAQDTWTVAGSAAALNGTKDWDVDCTDNDMMLTSGTTYQLTVTDCVLEKDVTYEFKVVKNHAWDEAYPGSNQTFAVVETAKYTVVYTFNSDTKEVSAEVTKTGEAGAIAHVYSIAGNNTDLFGISWDASNTSTDMTEVSTGNYAWLKTDITFGAEEVQFKVVQDHSWGVSYPAENYTFKPGAGKKNVLITFNSETKAIDVYFYQTFTVAGDSRLLPNSWDETDTDADMTLDGYEYKLNVTNKILPAGTYKFKVAKDHAWDQAYPDENYELTIDADGQYDVEFTFNLVTKEVDAVATKKADVVFKYYVTGDEVITKYDWNSDQNLMAVDAGTATLQLTDLDITKDVENKFKIVRKAYVGEEVKQEDLLGDPDNGGNDYVVNLSKTSRYTIDYSLNLTTGKATATPTEQITGYYIVTEGNPWTVQEWKMHLVPGTTTYTGGVQNWAGKCFAVAPNTALNDDFSGINDWNKVLRPKNKGSNYVVEFNYYADQVETKAENSSNNYTWKVADTNDGMVDIAIYNNGTFSITCCTQAAIGEEGYATYSVAGPCEITGATAYIVVEEGGSYKLKEVPADKAIPANTGVILKGSEGPYSVSSSTAANADVFGNLLIGTGGYTSYEITGKYNETDFYTPYIFAKGNNGVGFYLIKDFDGKQTIGAHKAFLALPKGAGAREFIGFDETGEATGISASLNEKGAMTNEKVFNLSGQRVSQPTKGLYIVNGKKFVK